MKDIKITCDECGKDLTDEEHRCCEMFYTAPGRQMALSLLQSRLFKKMGKGEVIDKCGIIPICSRIAGTF